MERERWLRIQELFHEALDRTPQEREAFLAACGDDLALRDEVLSLLAAEEMDGSFLDAQALDGDALEQLGVSVRKVPADRLEGIILDGKYRLEARLGRGGMGTVYRAVHLGTERTVALKVIAPEFMANEEFVERFKREAKAAGRLRHPNVVNVTDFGFASAGAQKVAYLVMEYLDGSTVADVIKRQGRLSVAFVAEVIEQAALAVDEAHQHGIIHRDLKPDNLWLEPDGRGAFSVKVLDFGIAKLRGTAAVRSADGEPTQTGAVPIATVAGGDVSATTSATTLPLPAATLEGIELGDAQTVLTDPESTPGAVDPRTVLQWLTRTGMVLGTPVYMSPEQCRGERLDARSDVYSLGVVAYEMLAGEPPFVGKSIYELIVKHGEMSPPPLRVKGRKIPKSVEHVVMKALSKGRADRPPSATAFATALRSAAEGEGPIQMQARATFAAHRDAFGTVSLVVYTSVVLASLLLLVALTVMGHWLPPAVLTMAREAAPIVSIVLVLFGGMLDIAGAAALVEQLRQAPLRSPRVRPALGLVARRLPQLALASLWLVVEGTLGLFKLLVPGLKTFAAGTLVAPVVVVEGIGGRAAVNRARELSARLPGLAARLQVRNVFLNVTVAVLFLAGFLVYGFVFGPTLQKLGEGTAVVVAFGFLAFLLTLPIVSLLALRHPLVAIAVAATYSVARDVGGESSKDASGDRALRFEVRERPAPPARTIVALAVAAVFAFTMLPAARTGALFAAVMRSDEGAVRAALAAGGDPTAFLLTMAAERGNPRIVLLLLDAQPERTAGELSDALSMACENGRTEVVELLLERGADVSGVGMYYPPLIAAVNGNHVHIVRLLLERGADIGARDRFDGKTALWVAKELKRKKIVDLLTAAGATE